MVNVCLFVFEAKKRPANVKLQVSKKKIFFGERASFIMGIVPNHKRN